MDNFNKIKKSRYAKKTTEAAESIGFTAVAGSNINPKWFNWLVQRASLYLFSIGLFLSILKFSLSLYKYIKSKNKNINQNLSFGWEVAQLIIISVIAIGTLAAGWFFAVLTPALLVATMAADALKNIISLFWNIGKLAELRFRVRKKLNDPLTKCKYETLKKKYIKKIKKYGKASIICTLLSGVIAIIFLFPHIGLGAIGTTMLAIGGIKLSVAGIAGIISVGALVISILPPVFHFSKWGLSQIVKGIKHAANKISSLFTSKVEKKPEPQPIIANTTLHIKKATFIIKDDETLSNAIQNDLEFSAFSKHSRFREMIIEHIEDKALATKALEQMVNEKIQILAAQLKAGKTSGYRYFAEKQRPKREQKLHALLLIKQQLEGNINVFYKYRNCFKNFNHINKDIFINMETLIKYIDSTLSGVKKSFFLDQSDTQNIIEAVQVYADKFPDAENTHSLSLS